MVSAATPASPAVPSPATTRSGRPAWGSRPPLVCCRDPGRSASNSTSAASTDLVDTGDSRRPVMHLEYRSIAIVSSQRTQRSVTGSIANTSSGVVSSSRNSPGRAGRSRP
jgi:hypothetical protein